MRPERSLVMSNRIETRASTMAAVPDNSALLIHAGLDTLDFGFAIFDRDLALVTNNKAFRTLRGYPAALCKSGTPLIEFYRFNAKRGDYGPGDLEVQAATRMERVRLRQPHALEYQLPTGQILNVQYTPIVHGGMVLAYADITARKRAELEVTRKEAQLRVALDNMPGALAYTDEDLNIVVCNDQYAEIYGVPSDLVQPGRPYPDLLRYLAEHGYYGDGDIDALVAKRVESLRNPSGKTFEDRPPGGRVYEVYRRKADAGGTVTVITDVTRLKSAEAQLAGKEAELHVALDNMPGALAYTDESLNIVVCNERFIEMYP